MRWLFRFIVVASIFTALWAEIARNWEILVRARPAFAAALILGALVSWFILQWAKNQKIENLQVQVETLEKQLKDQKDDCFKNEKRVLEYRQFLGLERKTSKYQAMSNDELKEFALACASQLDDLVAKWTKIFEERGVDFSILRFDPPAYPMREYRDKIAGPLGALRLEIKYRLPDKYSNDYSELLKEELDLSYIQPTSFERMLEISQEMKILANNLP